MKRTIILLFLAIIINSCSQAVEMEKSISYYGFDFTKYTKLGFLFTPEGWNGE